MPVVEEIKTTVDELLKILAMKNVVGEPMDMGDKVVITITKVGIAFAAGTGEGKGDNGMGGAGGGAGGVAGVSPVAVIVIYKDIPGPEGVKVLPLTPPSGIARAIGDIVSAVTDRMGPKAKMMKEKEKATTE